MDTYGRLQINLLGKPEVWLDGALLTSFSTNKTEAMLYYLAATGQLHSRETLAGLFWGEMPEAQARRNLTKSLTVLRRLLTPFLIIEAQRVGFDPDVEFELDVRQLETAVSSPHATPAAIPLYRGDFLEGFFVKDALAFEEWALSQRERLRDMAIGALEKLMAQAPHRRAYAEGIAYGRRLLELDPWRESAHRELMLLLARHGQQAAALAQYEQCRRFLAEELGVEPMPETTALWQRLQQTRRDRPYQLPASTTPFVGREEELAHINQRLADPGCRLLTLVGLGGVGKTRLALAAAQQANQEQAWHFLHGVVFVPLTAVPTPDLLPAAVADMLDLPLNGRQDPVMQLNHFLRDKEMLLVLDNFEHLLAGTAVGTVALTRLLHASPDIKLLVTSREPLQLEAEHRFDVGGLPFPANSDNLPGAGNHQALLADYPAIQLFWQAARQVRPQFELTPETLPAVIHICRVLAGIPLAIKLAASWLRVMTCAEIAAEIERNLDLLRTTMRDVPTRQRSMTAVFDHSWEMLTAGEQACLAGLSVFGDSFTAPAAQSVVNASLPILAGLVDRSLLHLRETPDGARYHLHQLTRQYAAARLAQSPATAVAMRVAHMRYYARRLAALVPELSGKTPRPAFDLIHHEIGNARHAWQHASEQGDLDSLHQLLTPLFLFYARQGWFAEGQERLSAALTAVPSTDRQDKTAVSLRSEMLAWRGLLAGRIGQFAAAETDLSQSVQLARQAADPHLLTFSLLELGTLLRDQSRFTEAADAFQESLDIAKELNDPPLIARATEKMGLMTWDQGSHVAAQARLAEALALFREQQNVQRMAQTLNSLGNVAMSMGDDRAALAYYQEALLISRELEDWLFLDTVLINLGMVSNNVGDYGQSRRYYEESLEICRHIGDEIGVAYCLTGLGLVCMEEGDLLQARQLLRQSLALNREMGRERYVAINLNLLGDVAYREQNWPEARRCFMESLAVSEGLPHRWGMASSHLRLGDLDVAQGDDPNAVAHYLTALSLGQEIEAEGIVLTALTNLAAHLLKRGETETAVTVLRIVAGQPAISDSLRQTVTALLKQETAVLSPTQQEQIQAKVAAGDLATAVAAIHASYHPL